MASPALLRLGGLLGLAFALLTLVASLVPHETLPEGPEAPPSEDVRAFFERNAAMQAMQPFTKILGAFCLLGLAAVLASILHDAGARAESQLVLAGGILFTTVLTTVLLLVASVVALAPVLDGGVVYAVYNVAWIANVRAGLAAVPMLVAFGVGAIRTRAFSRPTGILALVAAGLAVAGGAAALALAGPAGIGPAFLGFLALVVWALGMGIALLVRASRSASLRTEAAPDAR